MAERLRTRSGSGLWVATVVAALVAPFAMVVWGVAMWSDSTGALVGMTVANVTTILGSLLVLIVGLSTLPVARRTPERRWAHALTFFIIEVVVIVTSVTVVLTTHFL